MIFLCCHNCCSLLQGNYRGPLILWNSTSWSRLKLTVQIQLGFYPWDSFLINNCSMIGNSFENYCFVVLSVKLQFKLKFKMFCWLSKRIVLLESFTYPSNNRVIYRPELNLLVFFSNINLTKYWLKGTQLLYFLRTIWGCFKHNWQNTVYWTVL